MRTDQYVGLNKWAKNKVLRRERVREIGVRVLPSGQSQRFNRWANVPVSRRQQIGIVRGTYRPFVANLYRYTLPGGEVFEEYIQCTPWSGGPCYFIALKDKRGNPVPESLWTDEELSNA